MDLRELQKEYLKIAREVTQDKIQIGSLIRTVISEDEGLVFKDGRRQKPKKLIIIGIDNDLALCYGSLLINSKISPKADFSDGVREAQYILKQADYPEFLRYDSYVDCGVIIPVPITKLLQGEYFGMLNDEDFKGIFDILETTEIYPTKIKKRYGIRRRSVK